MKKIEHLPVNWVNGLKLNNGHFFETYYNMVDTVRQNREESLTSCSVLNKLTLSQSKKE